LQESSQAYQRALRGSPGAEYLSETRGLSADSAISFRLGYVESPYPGHERYAGMLAVPYLTKTGVTAIRFRRIGDGDGPKYQSEPGDEPRLYNPDALLADGPSVAICEGEMDTITAVQAGIPAVGVAGVSAWRSYFARCFHGYAAVYILADSDDSGQGRDFADKVAEQLENARIVPMPSGYDVNSFVLECGPTALLEKIGA
jgi:DNA primase